MSHTHRAIASSLALSLAHVDRILAGDADAQHRIADAGRATMKDVSNGK